MVSDTCFQLLEVVDLFRIAKQRCISHRGGDQVELGREHAALQLAAPHRQRRIMRVRDPFGDGEAESSPVHLAARRIGAHEAVEDPGQERFGDADAACL